MKKANFALIKDGAGVKKVDLIPNQIYLTKEPPNTQLLMDIVAKKENKIVNTNQIFAIVIVDDEQQSLDVYYSINMQVPVVNFVLKYMQKEYPGASVIGNVTYYYRAAL